jgi:hypothetical protein
VRTVAGGAHDGDDFFDLRRVRRVAQSLVPWRVAGVESRQRRRRSTSTGSVEQNLGHEPSSGSWNKTRLSPPEDSRPTAPGRRAIASGTEQRSTPIRDECRGCLDATADAESLAAHAALSRFVQLSSEGCVRRAAQECRFRGDQASPDGLLLVVRSGRVQDVTRDARSSSKAGVTDDRRAGESESSRCT